MRLLVSTLPTELADGRYPAPAWMILALSGAVIAGACVYLGLRFLRGPKEKR